MNRAWVLDVRTGERTALMAFSGNTPQLAADALAAEVAPAPDAPFAPDPRLVGPGLLVAALVLRRAYLLAGHAQDAEDLVQTTLEVVPHWRRIRDGEVAGPRRARQAEAGASGRGARR